MAQGRIKRLQSAARSQSQPDKASEFEVCALCDRPIPPALRSSNKGSEVSLQVNCFFSSVAGSLRCKPMSVNPELDKLVRLVVRPLGLD